MKYVLFLALAVVATSCSMGLKWDHEGDIQGYTKVAKLNMDEQVK